MQSCHHQPECPTCPDQSQQRSSAAIHGPGALFQPVFLFPLLSWEVGSCFCSPDLLAVLLSGPDFALPDNGWAALFLSSALSCLNMLGLGFVGAATPSSLALGGYLCSCYLSPDSLYLEITILIPIPSHLILVWGQSSVQVDKKVKVSYLLWSFVCKPNT